ncbi:pantetheine-phosphate adenylyltransferase [Candidatus Gottesmanbacteria bacterium]|nr:pantetheine-phosphate adenylyltransferase [Candidatus Gottesmanbacteria bacterium]
MYRHVFVAGTFNGLHAGHQALITKAFAVGKKVTIGLTTDAFVRKYKLDKLVPLDQLDIKQYSERKKALEIWLTAQKLDARASITPISDPYEPAASMPDLDALVVTAENKKRGEEINRLRQGASLLPLTLIDVPIVPAEDGMPISSTRMRNGEIYPDGRLVMPESMRVVLGKPLGKVLTGVVIERAIQRNRDKVIVTVGDVATKTLLDAGVSPALAIIDGKVGRKPFPEVIDRLKPASTIKSGPGFISREAVKAIRGCFTHQRIDAFTHHTLLIDGEEDLLVLPAILHTKEGTVLYYGQPRQGLVEVVVTDKKKREALAFIAQFLS